jgi:multidrug efflux pump subunit AcrB
VKSMGIFALVVAGLLLIRTAFADQPPRSVVEVSYVVSEQDVDRVDKLVTDRVERVLKTIPGVAEIFSTTGHGSVRIEVQFEGNATEQELAAVRQEVEELVLDDEVVVTSRTVLVKSPSIK